MPFNHRSSLRSHWPLSVSLAAASTAKYYSFAGFLVRFGLSWPAFPRTLWLSFLASSFSFSLLFLLFLLCAASDRQRRFGFSASQVSTLPVPFTFPLPPYAASMALSLSPVFRSTSSLLALSSSTVTRTVRTTWYVYDSSPSVVSTG